MRFLALFVLVFFFACPMTPREAAAQTNAKKNVNLIDEYQRTLLFVDEDGCKVWSFYDHGAGWSNYVSCPYGIARTEHNIRCGKTCTRQQAIYTLMRDVEAAAQGGEEEADTEEEQKPSVLPEPSRSKKAPVKVEDTERSGGTK